MSSRNYNPSYENMGKIWSVIGYLQKNATAPGGGGGGVTDHSQLTSIGTRTHIQIDAHIVSTANPHGVTKAQVGLSDVDNTSDVNKPVSTAQQAALNGKQATLVSGTNLKTVNGNSLLGVGDIVVSGGGTSDHTLLTNIGTNTHAQIDTHIANTANPHGVTKSQVGLSNVDNTSDISKPVSSAQQTALNLKADLASPTFTGIVGGITKSMVGLGSVDNTADSAKPVSTAQQTALNAKQATLVSGTNIKTVNGNSLVGSGDVTISGGGSAETQSALTYAATVTIDFSQTDAVRTIALTGNLTFANATNKAAAKSKTIILTADGTTRTLTFPASWIFLDQVAPTSLQANKIGVLSIYCKGTAETDVIVSYSAQL